MSILLVTGGSGFVAGHVILKLLASGHEVRTTLRNPAKEAALRTSLRLAGCERARDLAIVEADLSSDRGWTEAVAGCRTVLHIASPFPGRQPRDAAELIVPAREGTLRVLRAARDAGVERVVLTSSFAAIGYGHGSADKLFDETDWTDIAGADVQPYIQSKTLAERAAWDFLAREGKGLELAVINPVGVFGPVLNPALSSSVAIVKRLLEGIRLVPRLYFGIVDVRDLADLHLRAMRSEAALGQRFLAVGNGLVSLREVAAILHRELGPLADGVRARELPDWLWRCLALVSPQARAALPQLGIRRRSSNAKAQAVLGWQPRPYAETIADTAHSLFRHGIVAPPHPLPGQDF